MPKDLIMKKSLILLEIVHLDQLLQRFNLHLSQFECKIQNKMNKCFLICHTKEVG